MSLKRKTWRPGRWVEAGMLVTLLTAALFLRVARLDSVPPGMTHDEAAFGAEAERILAGERPIYFSLGYGHEPLYAYAVALAFHFLGHTLIALRITSAFFGMIAVLVTYLIARRLLGGGAVRGAALMAAATMAVAFWPVSLSRQALRAITLVATWLPAAWLFWAGVEARGGAVVWRPGKANGGPASAGLQTVPADGGYGNPPYGVRSGQSPTVPDGEGTDAWSAKQFLPFVLGGVLLGLSLYTYMASRVTWVVFPLWALVLLARKGTRQLLRRTWPGLVVFLLIALLVALPLVRYLCAHPEAERRVGNMMGPIAELLQGKPQRVLRHTWNALRVFSWQGDQFWAYNIPGRPVFGVLASILFYLGLAAAIWQWADPRASFMLIWLGVGLAPAMVTTNQGIFLRAIVAQPATYLLLSVGVRTVAQGIAALGRRFSTSRRWATAAAVLLAVVVVGIEAARTAQAYLVDWPSRPQARTIYNHNLVALSRYLRVRDETFVGVSALYPLYYHDPWIYRYVTGRDEREVRWFDGRGCIVYPRASVQAGGGGGQYVVPEEAPLHPTLWAEFAPHATLVERVDLAVSDENPYFELWSWQGGQALQADLAHLRRNSPMWVSPEVEFTQPELRQVLYEAPRFGDVMELVGYRVTAGEPLLPGALVQAGDTVELVTFWRALRTVEAEDDWVTFVHLLDRQSTLLGGVDVLHCPPTGWWPGDIVVQVHSFAVDGTAVASTAVAGEAYLEIGVYRRSAGRVPVWVGEEMAGDRVLLETLQIEQVGGMGDDRI